MTKISAEDAQRYFIRKAHPWFDKERKAMPMKLEHMPWMNNEEIGDRKPAAPPRIIMWHPPDGPEGSSGAPVLCASLERAQDAAAKFAGRHPGELMAVYQLVGYSYRAPTPAEFVEVEPVVTPSAVAIEDQSIVEEADTEAVVHEIVEEAA